MRIVAGKFKGITLHTFKEGNIRPTSDKVRQAVFNTIQFDITDSNFLDLFAGTGGVSLEAISRGAKFVATVEKNKQSIKLITKNFNKVGAESNLFSVDYLQAIKIFAIKNIKFDFIYIDPPFNINLITTALDAISKQNILKDNGLIICEHEKAFNFTLPNNMCIEKSKKYGSVVVSYLRIKDV